MPKELKDWQLKNIERFEKEALAVLPEKQQARAREAYQNLDRDTQAWLGRMLLEELAALQDWPQRRQKKLEGIPAELEHLLECERHNKSCHPDREAFLARLAAKRDGRDESGPRRK